MFDVRYNCEILWLERFTVHHKYLFTSLTLSLLSLVVLSVNTLVMHFVITLMYLHATLVLLDVEYILYTISKHLHFEILFKDAFFFRI